jgi:hypothetical protein
MTNPTKGEVTFEANGQIYTLKFSVNALCRLEAETGKGFPKLLTELSNLDTVSITLLRNLTWAGLQEHHPHVSINLAGDLIVAGGGMSIMLEKISKAIESGFPSPPSVAIPQGNASRPLSKAKQMEPHQIGNSPSKHGAV